MNGVTVTRVLKGIGALFEGILGIPILGGVLIVMNGYTPLGFMLMFHFVTFIVSLLFAKRFAFGSVIGIIASTVGIIPFVGMVLHLLAALILTIDAVLTKERRIDIEEDQETGF